MKLKKHRAMMKTSQFRDECPSRNHVGKTVRSNAIHQLLNFICGEERRLQPGHCRRVDNLKWPPLAAAAAADDDDNDADNCDDDDDKNDAAADDDDLIGLV